MNTKHLINKNHIKFLYMELNWNRELANAQLKKNVLNLTLPDKNSIVTHGKGSYSNNYSNSKQTTFRYADIPQTAGMHCQGFWISKGAEQMNRASNKAVAFIFFSGLSFKSSRISDNVTTD